jgi:hypothetical protein
MKNSSDFTRDILKNKELEEISSSDQFIPYLVQKYISGVSPEYCVLINNVLNTKLLVWKDPQEIYNLLKILIPKKKYINYRYFGKPANKKESKVDEETICNNLEISRRELHIMLETFPELEKELIEQKEKILKSRK